MYIYVRILLTPIYRHGNVKYHMFKYLQLFSYSEWVLFERGVLKPSCPLLRVDKLTCQVYMYECLSH